MSKVNFVKDERFRIHIERLRDGQETQISEKLSPEFLEVSEEALSFYKPISVQGKAYVAGDSLILNLEVLATAVIPCAICNKPVEIEVSVDNFYHAEPLEEIKGGTFDFRDVIREAILVDIPHFAECNDGKCPARKEIKKYLKEPEQADEEGYHPFADL